MIITKRTEGFVRDSSNAYKRAQILKKKNEIKEKKEEIKKINEEIKEIKRRKP